MLHSAILRGVTKAVLMLGLVVGGAFALWRYEEKWSEKARLIEENRRLEERNRHLQRFVQRLTSERRVADILVTEQVRDGNNVASTTLMFLEYERDGKTLLPPRFFTVKGNIVHIDSLVIKFENDFIEREDPLRGHSIVLFYRLFGEHQAPADAFHIDAPNQAPAIYQTDENLPPDLRAFEEELWQNFWKLADDPKYREEKGVRAAHGESPWTAFYMDRVYTLTLAANGNLTLESKPMDGLMKEFRAALARKSLPG